MSLASFFMSLSLSLKVSSINDCWMASCISAAPVMKYKLANKSATPIALDVI